MLKQAWSGYLTSLHPRYLRKAYDEGRLFGLFYWVIIYPIIMQAVTGQEEYYDIGFVVTIRLLPFGISMWSDMGSKYLMPKLMFLSPMKETERREYVNHVVFIKIGMTVFYSICGELLLSIFYDFNIFRILIIVFMNFSLALAIYISAETSDKKYRVNDIVKVGSGLTIIAIALLTLGATESLASFLKIVIIITTIAVVIMDIIIILKEYKGTIIHAGNYEMAFRIPAKEDKQVKFDLFQKKE